MLQITIHQEVIRPMRDNKKLTDTRDTMKKTVNTCPFPRQGQQFSNKPTRDSIGKSNELHNRNDGNIKKIRNISKTVKGYQLDPFGNVINLSPKLFSCDFKLLNRNLNVISNPGKVITRHFKEVFTHKILLQAHFGTKQNTNLPIFKPSTKSTWVPPNPYQAVQTLITAIEKNLLNNITNKETNPNLSKEEINSVNKLKSRVDIIITHADKGGAVIIIDVNDYIKKQIDSFQIQTFTQLPNISKCKNN